MKRKFTKTVLNAVFVLGLCSIMGGTSYAWDGKKDGTGTHALIAEHGLTMLNNDLNQNEPKPIKQNIEILNKYLKDLKLGSTFPDYDPNAYDLFQDHFFDPDTGNNFTLDNKWYVASPIYDTAETQVRKFATLAENEWKKGNYKEATFLLGQGMHYLGDLNTPYHAANVTAVDSPGHVKYETFVENRKENYALNTAGSDTTQGIYKDAVANKDFDQWMTQNSVKYAKKAKALYYSHSTMKHNWDDWDYSGREAIKNSQVCTAGFLYRFINEVSEDQISGNNLTNEFNVVLKTADNEYAGTDDNVYFGFETKDGNKYEWNLDNAGNDFEKNQTDNYILKVKNDVKVNTNDITKYWVRKENKTPISDDWELSNIKLISNGKVILQKDINKVFSGNQVYDINK
ncbi:phospholipase C (PLC) (phosphatidylcholinecholinephosphohydrolase) (gamma-toxin) [[Clostridium] sordellii]|uniref:phospholipase C n=1 Tax=Paraclostridium sordellii TaxID=1505 RepID=UPI0005E45729|nr:phospholipase C [Paeniclostridium sordellii]CEO16236.1 phospholipase C (PLC) (phosphatidylcholinecholinephosphohydrolase) (gamma-toxin) [[Clostridium] sordellii] [Paeniclostridium sordellii]